MAGYSRTNTGDIQANEIIKAGPLSAELNAIRDAFLAATGHTHDGTETDGGAYVPLISDPTNVTKVVVNHTVGQIEFYLEESAGVGIQKYVMQDTTFHPNSTNTRDLGTSIAKWKDIYIDGIGYIDDLEITNNATVDGNLTVEGAATLNGDVTLGTDASDTIAVGGFFTTDLRRDISPTYANVNLGAASGRWNIAYVQQVNASGNVTVGGNTTLNGNLSLPTGTATLNNVDINNGAIDNTLIGAVTPNAAFFTTIDVTNVSNLDVVNIDGGTIDNTTIGATTATTGVFTDLTATGTTTVTTADINGGNIDGTVIGATTPAAGTFTTVQTPSLTTTTGTATLATVDINGGNIDGTVIGATTPANATVNTLTVNSGLNIAGGSITGNVSGNLTGDVYASNGTSKIIENGTDGTNATFTGSVTGSLSGNVTAVSGTSTFNNVQINGNLDMNSSTAATITNLANPSNPFDAATKEYVDTIAAAGIHYHEPVRVESPSHLNATYSNGTAGVGATLTNASGTQVALVIDGITLSLNDRVLVYNQLNAAENGIYVVSDTGSPTTNWVLTRATDADSYGASDPNALGEGDAYFVKEGDTGAGELYVMNTSGTITFGTTPINFTVIAETAIYTAGDGLSLNGTQFNIGTADTGRIVLNANDIDLATTGVTAGTYTKTTVDDYGRTTAGSNPTAIADLGITNVYTKTEVDGILGSATAAATSAAAAADDADDAQKLAINPEDTQFTLSDGVTTGYSALHYAAKAEDAKVAAELALDTFDDIFLGAKATAPTVDNDGDTLQVGALYFDTSDSKFYGWDGSIWVTANNSFNALFNRQSYVATAGQTTFTISYDVGYVDVFLNGIKLLSGVDFTASNGTTVVLTTGATSGDNVDILAYGTFNVANTLSTSGGTVTGSLSLVDNAKATFGSAQNMEIFHDGTDNIIRSTSADGVVKMGVISSLGPVNPTAYGDWDEDGAVETSLLSLLKSSQANFFYGQNKYGGVTEQSMYEKNDPIFTAPWERGTIWNNAGTDYELTTKFEIYAEQGGTFSHYYNYPQADHSDAFAIGNVYKATDGSVAGLHSGIYGDSWRMFMGQWGEKSSGTEHATGIHIGPMRINDNNTSYVELLSQHVNIHGSVGYKATQCEHIGSSSISSGTATILLGMPIEGVPVPYNATQKTSNLYELVLTENITTFNINDTLGLVEDGCTITLYIKQDSTGGRSFTWPSNIKWDQGVTPTISSVANAVDVFVLQTLDGGTNWYGFVSGQLMS